MRLEKIPVDSELQGPQLGGEQPRGPQHLKAQPSKELREGKGHLDKVASTMTWSVDVFMGIIQELQKVQNLRP